MILRNVKRGTERDESDGLKHLFLRYKINMGFSNLATLPIPALRHPFLNPRHPFLNNYHIYILILYIYILYYIIYIYYIILY